MDMNLEWTFTIMIRKETDGYVGYVQENAVSSFWETKEEALQMTGEALSLWVESQFRYRTKKLSKLIKTIKSKKNIDTYTVNFQNASNIYSQGNMPKTQKDLICAR